MKYFFGTLVAMSFAALLLYSAEMKMRMIQLEEKIDHQYAQYNRDLILMNWMDK